MAHFLYYQAKYWLECVAILLFKVWLTGLCVSEVLGWVKEITSTGKEHSMFLCCHTQKTLKNGKRQKENGSLAAGTHDTRTTE